MNPLLIVVSLIVIAIGFAIIVKAERVGAAISGFYRNYPVVKHAGPRQFLVKRSYIVLLGIVIVAIGLAGLASVVL
jgi:hypothetical protein